MFNWLFKKGTVNFGKVVLDAKQNIITGKVSLLLSNDTMIQLFKEEKPSYDTIYDEDGYGMDLKKEKK